MMGAGYSGTCGSDVNLQVGYANGVNANLSTRYNVELYVMNSAAIAAIPTHYYALNEASGNTAIDSIGGVNGTLGGSPARVAGYSGNALSFNGSNYVTVPGNLGISSAMTISFWVKPNVLSAAMAAGFIGGGGFSDATAWVGGLNVASGIGFHQNSCGQETGAVLSTGSWQHVVITKHTGLIASYTKIYLDGVEKATSNYYGNCSVYIASNRFNIGAGWAASNTDYGINGLIDEVRIYNYALSPAEVALIP